jgi:hypothetical protein
MFDLKSFKALAEDADAIICDSASKLEYETSAGDGKVLRTSRMRYEVVGIEAKTTTAA